MQCNQPVYCTAFQNSPQFSPYNTQPYYPDVIGEGDVFSYILPDGSVQYYFVPTNKRDRWIPHWTNSYCMTNSLPTWSNNKEAWFVRSILNTYPAGGLNQLTNNYGDAFTRCNVNSPSYSFVQKFHNDGWTSTTDLHYFFPSLRPQWLRGCAGIQVEIPNEEKSIFHYGTVCNRPCYCNHNIETIETAPECVKSGSTETPMCVDEVKSTQNCCEDSRKKEKNQKNKNHTCACRQQRLHTADKVVTTYADQAISCTDMKRYNQTGKGRASERTNVQTEIWYPRRRKSKKNDACCSISTAACHSACCLGSNCSDCSNSEQFDNR